MKHKDFLLISTTKNGLGEQDKMLQILQTREFCNADFGNNFYPLIGINNNGEIKCVCNKDSLADNDLVLVIIPDNKSFSDPSFPEDEFNNYLMSKTKKCEKVYVLLHVGNGSQHDTHQNAILQLSKDHLPKIMVAKCHHTQSSSQNPKHALGDGLELIANAVFAYPVNVETFNTALDYLKSKPEYYSPLKESVIRLHKTLSISLNNIINFNIESLEKQDKYKLAVELLGGENNVEKSKIGSLLNWTTSKIIELSM